MTDTTSYVPVHLPYVAIGDSTGDSDYFATCSCGWSGEPHDEVRSAQIDAVAHRDGAACPPDRLDQAMAAMLDLQDDLAEVVVWLAENWSADLPAPFVYGTSHYDDDPSNEPRAGVNLLVPCYGDDVLARAAARLGVPVTTDLAPNSQGHRYRRAFRAFGRVHIDAYTLVEDGEPGS
jgi:hypothetical protein